MMLVDDKLRTDPSRAGEDEKVHVVGHIPDPARDGVVDVVSLRGLMRAVKVLRGGSANTSFDEALTRMINTNGSIARSITGD